MAEIQMQYTGTITLTDTEIAVLARQGVSIDDIALTAELTGKSMCSDTRGSGRNRACHLAASALGNNITIQCAERSCPENNPGQAIFPVRIATEDTANGIDRVANNHQALIDAAQSLIPKKDPKKDGSKKG